MLPNLTVNDEMLLLACMVSFFEFANNLVLFFWNFKEYELQHIDHFTSWSDFITSNPPLTQFDCLVGVLVLYQGPFILLLAYYLRPHLKNFFLFTTSISSLPPLFSSNTLVSSILFFNIFMSNLFCLDPGPPLPPFISLMSVRFSKF